MFPITMSFTVHSPEQMTNLQSALATLGAIQAKQEGAPPAGKPAPAGAAPETRAENSGAAQDSAGEAKAYTIDDAKKFTTDLVKKIGTDETRKLLAKYEAPVAAKLASEKVQPFCEDAVAALAA